MPALFPRHTIEWKLEEPPLLRRLTYSLPAMAVTTGILVHLFRWFALSRRSTTIWLFLLLFIVSTVLLLGLATMYLANYTVRQWLWRAPLFALVESVTEAIVSAALIAAGVERLCTQRATWSDWPLLIGNIAWRRTVAILLFAVLLGVTVHWVRVEMLRRRHRELVEGASGLRPTQGSEGLRPPGGSGDSA
jgi:hypothetical protein